MKMVTKDAAEGALLGEENDTMADADPSSTFVRPSSVRPSSVRPSSVRLSSVRATPTTMPPSSAAKHRGSRHETYQSHDDINVSRDETNQSRDVINLSRDETDLSRDMTDLSYVPQHPLPPEIGALSRNDTVCKFCGVSYLILNEIKKLEEKLKAASEEIRRLEGVDEQLREEEKKRKQLEHVSVRLTQLQSDMGG